MRFRETKNLLERIQVLIDYIPYCLIFSLLLLCCSISIAHITCFTGKNLELLSKEVPLAWLRQRWKGL